MPDPLPPTLAGVVHSIDDGTITVLAEHDGRYKPGDNVIVSATADPADPRVTELREATKHLAELARALTAEPIVIVIGGTGG